MGPLRALLETTCRSGALRESAGRGCGPFPRSCRPSGRVSKAGWWSGWAGGRAGRAGGWAWSMQTSSRRAMPAWARQRGAIPTTSPPPRPFPPPAGVSHGSGHHREKSWAGTPRALRGHGGCTAATATLCPTPRPPQPRAAASGLCGGRRRGGALPGQPYRTNRSPPGHQRVRSPAVARPWRAHPRGNGGAAAAASAADRQLTTPPLRPGHPPTGRSRRHCCASGFVDAPGRCRRGRVRCRTPAVPAQRRVYWSPVGAAHPCSFF